jgi:ABC-type Fe3+ transport system permease subunit
MTYGTIAVRVLKQLTMLAYGGFAPSIRTISWAAAAVLCVAIVAYELLRDKVEYDVSNRMIGLGLLVCGTLLAVSSFAVWNEAFKAVPVGFGFFAVCGHLFMKMEDLP